MYHRHCKQTTNQNYFDYNIFNSWNLTHRQTDCQKITFGRQRREICNIITRKVN